MLVLVLEPQLEHLIVILGALYPRIHLLEVANVHILNCKLFLFQLFELAVRLKHLMLHLIDLLSRYLFGGKGVATFFSELFYHFDELLALLLLS